MKQYYNAMKEDPYVSLPITFHCERGQIDMSFREFLGYFQKCEKDVRDANLQLKELILKRTKNRQEFQAKR
jgi:hypothetical protein